MKKFFKNAAVMTLAVMASAVMLDVPATITVEAASATGDCNGTHTATWTTWAGGAFAASGSYYLNEDVPLTAQVEIDNGVDVTLCLNGYTITAGDASRIFYVKDGGSLTLCNCNGDGILKDGAPGETDKDSCGGAVYIEENGTFTMYGGTISGNSAQRGAGVYNSGIFIMYGGTISDNTAEHQGGGVYNSNSGDFTMSGGTISGNKIDATVADDYGGGGVYTAGAVTMSGDSTISGNTANSCFGGGVCVSINGDFTMNSGTISGNTSNYGGGVYVSGGTFNMTNGTIGGANEATNGGGGVCVGSGTNTEFTMSGGTISHNISRHGGGVNMTDGKMTLNGTVNITENKSSSAPGSSESNIYLVKSAKDNMITIGTNFNTADPIGVHASTRPDCTNYVNATQFAAGVQKDIIDKFKADTDKGVIYDNTGSNVQLLGTHRATEMKATEATCTTNGNTEHWHCSACNKNFVDKDCTTELTSSVVIPATGHNYGGWIVTKAPDLTTTGTAIRICANDSSHTETKTLPMLSGNTDSSSNSDNSSDNSSDTDNSVNSDDASGNNTGNGSDNNSNLGNVTDNPPTGIAISLVPLAAAITAVMVTVKRNKK